MLERHLRRHTYQLFGHVVDEQKYAPPYARI
jgi:hypothetical protein